MTAPKSHGRKAIRPTLQPSSLMDEAPDLVGVWQARIVTLFPETFPGVLGASLTGKALQDGKWQLHTHDLRGHGASPCPGVPFGLEELVADLEQLRRRVDVDSAHIAGHSLGGMIGPAYARLYPDRVLSLGLLSTAAFRTKEDSEKVWAVVKAMEDKGVPNVLNTLIDRWYTDGFIEAHRDIVDRRLKQVVDTNPEVFLNVFRIYAGTEMAQIGRASCRERV